MHTRPASAPHPRAVSQPSPGGHRPHMRLVSIFGHSALPKYLSVQQHNSRTLSNTTAAAAEQATSYHAGLIMALAAPLVPTVGRLNTFLSHHHGATSSPSCVSPTPETRSPADFLGSFFFGSQAPNLFGFDSLFSSPPNVTLQPRFPVGSLFLQATLLWRCPYCTTSPQPPLGFKRLHAFHVCAGDWE